MLAYNPKNMTEDEREHLLSTVGQAHAGLSEVALKLRLELPPKTPALKTAIKAERAAFDLKRSLQRLEVKDVETIARRAPVLPEVRRGGKVVDPESLLRHENRHDRSVSALPGCRLSLSPQPVDGPAVGTHRRAGWRPSPLHAWRYASPAAAVPERGRPLRRTWACPGPCAARYADHRPSARSCGS